jgi:uncharacterized protein (TIGR03435 family)
MLTSNLSRMMLLISASILALEGAFTLHGAQGRQTAQESFEVISVKAIPSQPVGGRGSVGACGGNPQVEPARFAASRTTVYSLIAWAYAKRCPIAEAHDLISGEPAWIKSDLFEIQAVISQGRPTYTVQQLRDGEAPKLQLMIQNLLQDRFKLKAHSENRNMSIYALVTTKGGARLKPFEEGSCGEPALLPLTPGQKPRCGYGVGVDPLSLKLGVGGTGVTLERFAQMLSNALDRPVIDMTGISGVFDIHLESSVEGTRIAQLLIEQPPLDVNPGLVAEPAPSIFSAIQDQLGLKLEPTKGPVEVLVIDHAEKPNEN